jgi:hypothetical protein
MLGTDEDGKSKYNNLVDYIFDKNSKKEPQEELDFYFNTFTNIMVKYERKKSKKKVGGKKFKSHKKVKKSRKK